MSREQILANLRKGLERNRAWLQAEAAAAPHAPPPFVLPSQADRVEQFVAELAKLEGRPQRVADNAAALAHLAELLRATHADRAIAWDLEELALPGLAELLVAHGVAQLSADVRADGRKAQLQILEPAQVCISGVDLAIAESGSLLIVHGPRKPRLASLLAPTHIALVRAPQIVRGLGEALGQIAAHYGAELFDATSNMTLITGPSRTADIEMTLTLGIHGPKAIHVIVIG